MCMLQYPQPAALPQAAPTQLSASDPFLSLWPPSLSLYSTAAVN